MDQKRLDELTARAASAKKLAEEIALLNAATPGAYATHLEFTGERGKSLLPDDMLKEVVKLGRESLIARKESELERLLGIEQPTKALMSPLITQLDPVTPHTGYQPPTTADQPAEPFATITC